MYISILAKVEEVNDGSYPRPVKNPDGTPVLNPDGTAKEELVAAIELSLVIPTMRDRIRVKLSPEVSPKQDILDRWELEETWVMVSSDSLRANAFTGAKGPTALVTFNAVEVREATQEERAKLQQARKAVKQKNKQARAQRKAERDAQKKASKTAA
jgi:hypothetical protein